MSNFWDDLMEVVGDESVEAVVIGDMGWGDYNSEGKPPWRKATVLSTEDAKPMLDYEYSTEYGAPECQAVNVYTPTRVIFVSQYDGSTSVTWVMRNPTEGDMPGMPGGG
jgi:hypothetical protein